MMECEGPSNFAELELLHQTEEGYYEWKEKARWIKLEEDIEEGSGRWSKPFIPKISYKSICELQKVLSDGDVLLDVQETTLHDLATIMCESLINNKVAPSNCKRVLQATLLARHHHYHQKNPVCEKVSIHKEIIPKLKCSTIEPKKTANANCDSETLQFLEDDKSTKDRSLFHCPILSCMEPNSEASIILVANLPYVHKTCALFVRLRQAAVLGNLTEISLPVRFLFLVIGTKDCDTDCYQIGRALGTLVSNKEFCQLALNCQEKSDLLNGIKSYLIGSNILPHGRWNNTVWNQSFSKWNIIDPCKKDTMQSQSPTETDNSETIKIAINTLCEDNSLQRTGKLFGGLMNDIRRKIPFFLSDFTDVLNTRCLIAVIFIYFSFLSPAITFAAIMSNETHGLLGVSEMIASTAVCGIIFGLIAGQPLIILGATGPLLVMEEGVYNLSEQFGVEFLAWRAWIGFWITLFCIIIVAFDLSFLVRYFTLFTEEVIAALISAVFIQEAFHHIYKMVTKHYLPTVEENRVPDNPLLFNGTEGNSLNTDQKHGGLALMAMILMFGTCLLCHYIMKLRHSTYFPRRFRRLLSDFGIFLSVLIFVFFDILMKDSYTPALDIPDGFTPTSPSKRGWLVDIMGKNKKLNAVEIVLASIPAFLVTIILFMETAVTGTIIDRKEHKLVKGSGYHLDIFAVGLLVSLCSVFGLPWMCACPVHSIAHLNSLLIFNSNHAPGTRSHVVRVIEQRMTNILMHVLIGLSVFLAPLLRFIPISVLLGVFLFLGVTALSHLQLTERFKLIFIPPSHHPDRLFVREIKTSKIHFFTCIQMTCFIILFIIKNTILAPSFPFFILLMLPLRRALKKFFTDEELFMLDNLTEENLSGDVDEYDLVHVPM